MTNKYKYQVLHANVGIRSVSVVPLALQVPREPVGTSCTVLPAWIGFSILWSDG